MTRSLALVLLAVALAGSAAAQSSCRTALSDADASYRTGDFDRTIDRLTGCLDGNAFSADQRRQAYRLIGLSYVGKDREADARDAVRSLLEVAPNYQPDPAIDPPPFVRIVAEERRNRPRAASGGARLPSPAGGFSGALRAQGTSYSDDGGSLSGGGGELALGYGFTPALGVVLKLGGASVGDGIALGNFGLGAQYRLGAGRRKLVPFVGASAAFQTATLTSGGVSVDFTGGGGEVEAGVLYYVTPSFALNGGVTALFTSLSNEAVTGSISATTVSAGAGITWSPGR